MTINQTKWAKVAKSGFLLYTMFDTLNSVTVALPLVGIKF